MSKKTLLLFLATLTVSGCSNFLTENQNIGSSINVSEFKLSPKQTLSMLSVMSPLLSIEEEELIKKAHYSVFFSSKYSSSIHLEKMMGAGVLIQDKKISELNNTPETLKDIVEKYTSKIPSEYAFSNPKNKAFYYYFSKKHHETISSFISEINHAFHKKISALANQAGFNLSVKNNDHYLLTMTPNGIGLMGMENIDTLIFKTAILTSEASPVYWGEIETVIGYQPTMVAVVNIDAQALIQNKFIDLKKIPAGRKLLSTKIFNDRNLFAGFIHKEQLYAIFNGEVFNYSSHKGMTKESYHY